MDIDILQKNLEQNLKTNNILRIHTSIYELTSVLSLKDFRKYFFYFQNKKITLETLAVTLKVNIVSHFYKNEIQEYFQEDPDALLSFILKYNKRSSLNESLYVFAQKHFDIQNNPTFYKNIVSFDTLLRYHSYGKSDKISFWTPVVKNKENSISTFLAFYLIEKKHRVSRFLFDFIKTNLDDLHQLEAYQKSPNEIKTIIANTFSFVSSETQYRKILKAFDIKDNEIILNMPTCSISDPSSTIYTTKDYLLKRNKLTTLYKAHKKTVDVFKNDLNSPLINLLTSAHNFIINSKSSYNKYIKGWNSLYQNVNFQEEFNGKNLLEQMLDFSLTSNSKIPQEKIIPCNLPIPTEYIDQSCVNSSSFSEIKTFLTFSDYYLSSWIKLLELFDKKEVSFTKENSKGLLLSQVVSSLFYYPPNNLIEELFEQDSFLSKKINQLTPQQYAQFTTEIKNQWDDIIYIPLDPNNTYNMKYVRNNNQYKALSLIKFIKTLFLKNPEPILPLWDSFTTKINSRTDLITPELTKLTCEVNTLLLSYRIYKEIPIKKSKFKRQKI